MSSQYNKSIILNIIEQYPSLGKTAIMKILYILQQVKKMELNYDFSIYTYGPYSAGVIEDIDDLIKATLIDVHAYEYNNYVGYNLNLTERGESKISGLPIGDKKIIKEVVSFVNKKPAKTMELLSTIIFIENQYAKNNWKHDQKDIVEKVREIKPHFKKQTISRTYKILLEKKYIQP